jgi:methylmalonyl-CoA mutase C-terminal domain/subunit
MEVIYTGLHQTPEMIVEAAIQEDVDVVALSTLSGNHMTVFPRLLELLEEHHLHVVVLGGGIIPREDAEILESRGVSRIFGPGTDTREVVRFVREALEKRARRPARA